MGDYEDHLRAVSHDLSWAQKTDKITFQYANVLFALEHLLPECEEKNSILMMVEVSRMNALDLLTKSVPDSKK